ncbi:DksA/TraR family C4-type zinc finger protein [Serratia sp. JSRIV001]|uniref:DksA/TraR family C4-type zinc finger protein n=1 Tax=Serratia sp. JSRIV001 TaxID=2831893 RepID=UPI001CBFF671|nr:DksA/TraR family C4-type zinc finger protein [Serratia sp. JSRIV001]UAN47531.1 DksA/TraR family C4-type zinc finger protein [Serratia sp. JSRIV001]
MAGGWTADGAVQDQIDSTVDDAVQRARKALGHGESEHYCQECGTEIPEARRLALQGVRYCVNCQAEMDKKQAASSLFQTADEPHIFRWGSSFLATAGRDRDIFP